MRRVDVILIGGALATLLLGWIIFVYYLHPGHDAGPYGQEMGLLLMGAAFGFLSVDVVILLIHESDERRDMKVSSQLAIDRLSTLLEGLGLQADRLSTYAKNSDDSLPPGLRSFYYDVKDTRDALQRDVDVVSSYAGLDSLGHRPNIIRQILMLEREVEGFRANPTPVRAMVIVGLMYRVAEQVSSVAEIWLKPAGLKTKPSGLELVAHA